MNLVAVSMTLILTRHRVQRAVSRLHVGPEADAARREARATWAGLPERAAKRRDESRRGKLRACATVPS